VVELATESAKKREHDLAVTDGIAELAEGRSHGLQLAAVVGDHHGVLAEVAELRLQEMCTRLLLPEEFIVEIAPCLATRRCRIMSDCCRSLETVAKINDKTTQST
jgi:hypothetical protein